MLTLVSVPVPPTHVLPQWHVKDPGHSAKGVGGRLQINTHAPATLRISVASNKVTLSAGTSGCMT